MILHISPRWHIPCTANLLIGHVSGSHRHRSLHNFSGIAVSSSSCVDASFAIRFLGYTSGLGRCSYAVNKAFSGDILTFSNPFPSDSLRCVVLSPCVCCVWLVQDRASNSPNSVVGSGSKALEACLFPWRLVGSHRDEGFVFLGSGRNSHPLPLLSIMCFLCPCFTNSNFITRQHPCRDFL